ncbi:MAG: ABC transporter permease [Sphingomonadales bacterium]|nr:MAG: ABC transporter permease [Sphingomonadales bacterium]TNF06272.1 MAG: ABC transporter permease [Sphingomonadales bacterium]
MSVGFSLRRLRALFLKETVQILRDPSTFLIAFLLPLILLILFGYGINLDSGKTRIGLVVQDDSQAALSLATTFRNNRWFDVRTARSIEQLKPLIVNDKIRGIIVIPQDFGKKTEKGETAPIQIITDGSLPNTADFIAAYAEGLRATWAADRAITRGHPELVAKAMPVQLDTRVWFNPSLTSRYFLIPGSIAIVMTMIGTLLTALVVAREWERGTMEAMMATPMQMTEFIASKILPYFTLGLGSMVLCTVLAVMVFGVPLRGSLFALFLIAATYLLPALGLGLFISSATKNQFAASQIALMTGFLPTLLLSGFLFEIPSMPKPIQWLTVIVPARYLVPPLQTVFAAGDIWSLILPNVGIMLLFGIGFFLLSFLTTRRSLD